MRSDANKPESLEQRLEKRIARKRGDVFLRADFDDMGGYDQVGRALRKLIRKGRLLKAGYGIYTRARPSSIDGQPTPIKGLRELAIEALGRLGVETAPTRFERAYNSGQSEQVPSGRVIGILGKRIRRKIGCGGMFLSFERASPDRPKKRRKADQPGRTPEPPIAVREALRLVWEADRYPIRGNEDWRASAILMRKALARAASAIASPDDPPEFAGWLAALQNPSLPE
jgi:Family of unknown function (DUF6088)